MSRLHAVVLLSCGFALCGVGAHGQAPITSLPRPADDTDPPPQPQTYHPQQAPQTSPAYPGYVPQPITSLPKPPGAPYPTYVPPTPQPDTTNLPATYSAPPATPPAAPAPTPVPPATTPTVAYTMPNSSTSAPQQPVPVQQPLYTPAPAEQVLVKDEGRVRPFSTVGIQVKVGSAGVGLDIATPLTQHFNLRVGGNFFKYTGTYDDSGNHIAATAQLQSGSAYIEYFPWAHSGFRLAFGAVYDGNTMNGTANVVPGTEFDLGDGKYFSSAADPVHGPVSFDFGKKLAPSFTLGFGNIIPRSRKHFSFPFEVGFMYVGRSPALLMTLGGSVCDASTPPNCQKIDNDPEAQADLKKELSDINSNITFLKFYPIISQGISFKF